MKLLRMLGIALVAVAAVSAASAQSQWQQVTPTSTPNIGAGAMALLTDGRVLVHDESGNPGTWQNWWTLTPSSTGSYVNGTWTQVASTSSSYGPLYFGSAVLPDGRYIIEGGEYNNGNDAWTKLGAIYDPVANSWTSVTPPAGWSSIGDGSATVLANGTYMQGSCCDQPIHTALLNASNLTWTATGTGKFDVYDEEGLTLLPGGQVLDVDAYVFKYQSNGMNYELYNPTTGVWTSQGNTPVQLWDSHGTYEEGPDILMANGTVYATGANSVGAGHTAVYNYAANTWVAGPDFPGSFDIADGPGALETNGNVLLMASPGFGDSGAEFFEWNGSTLNEVSGPPNGPGDSSYYGHFLMLPTGQLMFTDFSNDIEVFNSTGSEYTGWTPTVILTSATIQGGTTIKLSGFKFNGVSQDSMYGDDFQDATNYPIVRFTSQSTGSVYYARTHDHSTMSVGYVGPTYTMVDVPSVPTGEYNLQVVVNGIASQNYPIGIR